MISDAAGVCLIILRILSGPAPGASQESLYSTQGQRKAMIVVFYNENYDIASAMSSSHADPVLGHCPGWGYLNI